MPYLETPQELAEQIADWCGIYGTIERGEHSEKCKCRPCFTAEIIGRIRDSVANEKFLGKANPKGSEA